MSDDASILCSIAYLSNQSSYNVSFARSFYDADMISRPPVFYPLLSDLPAGKLLGLPQVVGELKVVILKALKVVQLAHAETKPWETAISHYSVHTFGSSCEMDNPKLLEPQILFDQY